MSKNGLYKKIEQLNEKYSREVTTDFEILKNLYQGKDQDGIKVNGLHKLVKRYEVAEQFTQSLLDKEKLTQEQKNYIIDLSKTFVNYDQKLDSKRTDENYKREVAQKRNEHIQKTSYSLEGIINEHKSTQASTAPLVASIKEIDLSRENSLYQRFLKGFKKSWKPIVAGIAVPVLAGLLFAYCGIKKPVTTQEYTPVQNEKAYTTQMKAGSGGGPGGCGGAGIAKKEVPQKILKKEKKVLMLEQIQYNEKELEKRLLNNDPKLLEEFDMFYFGPSEVTPSAVFMYKKGTDKLHAAKALSGDEMKEDIKDYKKLEEVLWNIERLDRDESVTRKISKINNNKGEIVGYSFTNMVDVLMTKKDKDGKVKIFYFERKMNGSGGDSGAGVGGGGAGDGGGM